MSDCPVCHMPAPRHHMSCYAPRVTEQLKPCPFCGSSDVDLEPEWAARYQRNDCGANAPSCATRESDSAKAEKLNTRVSPWRSLKDDPPEPPTEETNYALLVRASPLDRYLADDRYRLLVPYQDSDNGNQWRWFESHLDYVLEDVIDGGYSEWMEVPK